MSGVRGWWVAWAVLAIVAVFAMPALAGPGSASAHTSIAAPPPIVQKHGVLPAQNLMGFFLEAGGQRDNGEVLFSSADGQVGFGRSAIFLKLVESPSSISRADKGLVMGPTPLPGGALPAEPEVTSESPAEPPTARGALVRLSFEGANRVLPVGRGESSVRANFLVGNDPAQWRVGLRGFQEVLYPDLYDGIDLVYRTTEQGVKYEFLVRPGADPSRISIEYSGTGEVMIDASGGVVAPTAVGDLRDTAPIAYQGAKEVSCPFELRGAYSVGFRCKGQDASRSLVVDPLVYSTFMTQSADTFAGNAIAVDAAGSAYVTGSVFFSDFPVTPGAFDTTYNGREDVLVAKLNPAGTALEYATYLGGQDRDVASSIAIDAAGNAYVAGHTLSWDFPVTVGAIDTTSNGRLDAFVAKLNPAGSALVYATYLGGSDDDGYCIEGFGCRGTFFGPALIFPANSIAVDTSGVAYVAGTTKSRDFPVTPGAFDTSVEACFFSCDRNAYVTKISPAGSDLVYSTYLGGTKNDQAFSLAIDAAGNAYVAGHTASTDFPVTPGAFDTSYDWSDTFVAKLNPTGSNLVFATYIGGTGSDGEFDFSPAVAVDAAGSAYVSGSTGSIDFPVTPGAFDTSFNGRWDSFVAKLNPAGSGLVYATYLGGSRTDNAFSIAVDAAGDAYITGRTDSTDFPVTPSDAHFDTSYNDGWDAYVVKIDREGGGLVYGTYLGGIGNEAGRTLALDAAGDVYVTGDTVRWLIIDGRLDFPLTPGAFDTEPCDCWGSFVAKLRDAPIPNSPPTASIDSIAGPTPVFQPGQLLTFAGSYTDADLLDTEIATWDFGDGDTASQEAGGHGAATFRIRHPLPSAFGTITVTLAVADGHGGIGTATATIEVPSPAPEIDSIFSPTSLFLLPGQVLTFRGGVTVGGAPIVFADVTTVRWDFGDGSTAITTLGAYEPASFTATHTYATAGAFSVTLTLAGSHTGRGMATATVEIITPAQAARILAAYIVENVLGKEANGLAHPLTEAAQSLEKGNIGAARNQIGAFLNQVEALQRNGRLDWATADFLMLHAEAVRDALG